MQNNFVQYNLGFFLLQYNITIAVSRPVVFLQSCWLHCGAVCCFFRCNAANCCLPISCECTIMVFQLSVSDVCGVVCAYLSTMWFVYMCFHPQEVQKSPWLFWWDALWSSLSPRNQGRRESSWQPNKRRADRRKDTGETCWGSGALFDLSSKQPKGAFISLLVAWSNDT